ncbi:cupredoxin domain-containing protein [Marinobacter salicampi]|uniref:cupredoxin domain-containing protein n=1 Tax=Marinobacter salicampi TaxID=435907 RepID=UPI001407A2D9|nr:plastocyanin/azurin family copper-binding protein [Marinobacter salicampi]
MSIKFRMLVGAMALALTGGVYAAGEHGGHHGSGGNGAGEPGDASDVSRTVEVVMYDNYYEPENISVESGETVRFKVWNDGALVHEFNIGSAEMHEAHQQEMQMMVEHGVLKGDHIDHDMMNMDMGDGHSMKHDDPNSVLLEPGESAEIIWTFTEASDLEFACNVPGHYQAGMYGDIEFK